MAGITHAEELKFVDGAELVAVCSRHMEKVRTFAEHYEVECWYTDYRALLKNRDIDVVMESIFTIIVIMPILFPLALDPVHFGALASVN